MGFALADAAAKRGARVTVIAGAATATPPAQVALIRAYSADDMREAVLNQLSQASIFIGAAAVADYRPVVRAAQKIKKSPDLLALELEPTPDILQEVSAARHEGLLVIGFAAETENVMANAREKLKRKNLDAIVANDVTREGAGFDTDANEVTILTRDNQTPIHVPLIAKTNVADLILDEIVRMRARVNPASLPISTVANR